MWVLIYWICTASACNTNNLAAFSTEEICQQAAKRLEEEDSIMLKQRVSAVCVNSDISYFE